MSVPSVKIQSPPVRNTSTEDTISGRTRFALKPANIMPEKQRRADMSANNNLGHAFVMFGLAVFWPCVLGNIAGIIISRIKIED